MKVLKKFIFSGGILLEISELTPTYLVAPLVVDGSHVDGADGAHAEHEEEGQADVDDGGELIEVGFHLVLYIP